MKKISLIIMMFFLVGITSAQTAKLQVIHNSAAKDAKLVDVWIKGSPTALIKDFKFRTASPFVDAPAGMEFIVQIKATGSKIADAPLFEKKLLLENGKKYVAVANGIIGSGNYSPGADKAPFDLYAFPMAREKSSMENNTDVLVFHGATDAPAVNIAEVSVPVGNIIENLSYSKFNKDYLELESQDYSIQIKTIMNDAVAQYKTPLSALKNKATVVLASGFLDPSKNNNGPSFGLFAALPTGGELVEFPSEKISPARLQVIHNSAAKDAKEVDVWLKGSDEPLLKSFKFRTASPFVDAPAGKEITIQIKGPNSKKDDKPLFEQKARLASGDKFIAVANGIIGSGDYNPGADKAGFGLFVTNMAREKSSMENNTDVLVFHGATDAPAVNIAEVSVPVGNIIENLSYSKFFNKYLELASQDYSLQIRTTGNDAVAQFKAPLSGLKNIATVVVASGFLNPSKNENGAAFGLFAALPTGGDLIELPLEKISTARLQIIHNVADKSATKVDVRVNNTFVDKSLDDFAFRTSTPFLDVPAATKLKITINAPDSEDDKNAIFTQEVELEAGKRYIVIANGIVSDTGYEPGSDKAPFNLAILDAGKEKAMDSKNVDVMVYHGSTDAPNVDITEKKVVKNKVIENLAYNKFHSSYLTLPENNYEIGIESNGTEVAAYLVPGRKRHFFLEFLSNKRE